jgi:hypothetical protein
VNILLPVDYTSADFALVSFWETTSKFVVIKISVTADLGLHFTVHSQVYDLLTNVLHFTEIQRSIM